MSLLPDSIRKLCDKCTLFSNRCAGVCQRRRSAAHLRRCVCPRRCRGLAEGVTARAVGFRTTARDDEVRRARSGSATTAIGDEVRRARSYSATTAIGDEVRRARSYSASGGVAHL